MLARISAFILAVTIFLAVPFPTFAQTITTLSPSTGAQEIASQSATPSTITSPLPPTVSPTSPLYTDLLVTNLFHTFSCLAVGQSLIGQPCLNYQITKNAQGMLQGIPMLSQTNNLDGGAMGAVDSVLIALYRNPPVKTGDYLASVSSGLGLVKDVRAEEKEGSGALILSPVLKLWEVSRNIAYILLIIIFLVIGLMIMFRSKINPQTVISAQAALPGLVIGLLMITFSFFFAGLISDTAFIATNLVGYYFQAAQGTSFDKLAKSNLVGELNNTSVIAVFGKQIPGDRLPTEEDSLVTYIQRLVHVLFDNAPQGVQDFMRFAATVMAFQYGEQIGHIVPRWGDLVGLATGLITAAVAATNVDWVAGLLLSWIAMVVLLWSMLKLLFNLIKAYLMIIFLTITAPFQLLAAALPGRQGMVTNWMLNLLANVLAFPAVLAVLYFVAYLFPRKDQIEQAGKIIPPFHIQETATTFGTHTFPLLGGLNNQMINFLVAFAALTILPAIPDVINRTVGRPGAAGELLGREFTGNLQTGRGYSNQWQQLTAGFQKVGQDISTFKGKPPGYAPSIDVAQARMRKGKEQMPRWMKFLRLTPRGYEKYSKFEGD